MGRNKPDEDLGAGKVVMVSRYGPQRCLAESIFSERWTCMGPEGGEFEPTEVGAQHGKCAVCASSVDGSRIESGGRGESSPPKTIPGTERSAFFYVTSERAVGGSEILAKKVPYQAQSGSRTPKTNNELGKKGSGRMVER